ncbi:MAG TPA: hypothetical protein VK451_12475 [Methyloceanibacter sp.]|jgi:hypothetical protein|nr:hypothetical protein [Methyloceanibacter sp.]
MMPVLRFIAVALLVSSSVAVLGMRAVAEPLDKASCASLANDRKKLFTPNMQAALDRGPDWVKDHLNDQELDQVRKFLDVEAQIAFRCRGGGVDKKTVAAAPTEPATSANTDDMPLPDRKPALEPTSTPDTDPSQTVADSDKTAPSKTKATR